MVPMDWPFHGADVSVAATTTMRRVLGSALYGTAQGLGAWFKVKKRGYGEQPGGQRHEHVDHFETPISVRAARPFKFWLSRLRYKKKNRIIKVY